MLLWHSKSPGAANPHHTFPSGIPLDVYEGPPLQRPPSLLCLTQDDPATIFPSFSLDLAPPLLGKSFHSSDVTSSQRNPLLTLISSLKPRPPPYT